MSAESRLALRHRLLALLHQALALVEGDLGRPVVVRGRDRLREASLSVAAVGHAAGQAAGGEFPGHFFSDLERLVWMALAGKDGLSGKQVAKALGRRGFDTELKIILRNLVRRGVLIHSRERGYSRAHRPPAGKAG